MKKLAFFAFLVLGVCSLSFGDDVSRHIRKVKQTKRWVDRNFKKDKATKKWAYGQLVECLNFSFNQKPVYSLIESSTVLQPEKKSNGEKNSFGFVEELENLKKKIDEIVEFEKCLVPNQGNDSLFQGYKTILEAINAIQDEKDSSFFKKEELEIMFHFSKTNYLIGLQTFLISLLPMHPAWNDEKSFIPII